MHCDAIVNDCLRQGYTIVPEREATKILGQCNIPFPASNLAATASDCRRLGEQMGFPLVAKIQSREISHKSDIGGVVTGITSMEQLEAAYATIRENAATHCPDAAIEGVMLQQQAPKGVEVVVGAVRNEQFGPAVMFGLGGIYIEVFKDVSFRLAPLDASEALRQIRDTKVYTLLQGVRGQAACDIEALCELVVNTGNLITTCAKIKEIDFNPVICTPTSCIAVDTRIVIGD